MKKLFTLILFFQLSFTFSQSLSTIRYEKEYKSISLAKPTVVINKEIVKDTILVRDTIFLNPKNQGTSIKNNVPILYEVSSPLERLNITSNYGMRLHPIKRKWMFHSGVDFSANNDTVKSVLNGTVHSSGYNNGLGYFVKIESGNYIITYAHLSQFYLLETMDVKAGEPIGLTGNTGLSTGEHLHFSVHQDGRPIDPIEFLKSLVRLKTVLANNIKSYEKRTIN